MKRYYCLLALLAACLAGCNYLMPLVATDERSVAQCEYLGGFEAMADPGQVSAGTLRHYIDTTGVEYQVLRQAAQAGATHVVWLHRLSDSAAALGYRCPTTPAEPQASPLRNTMALTKAP
jgi:hypothetical protein